MTTITQEQKRGLRMKESKSNLIAFIEFHWAKEAHTQNNLSWTMSESKRNNLKSLSIQSLISMLEIIERR